MRQDWFNRIHDIFRKAEEANRQTWNHADIGKLFGLKRSAAYEMMSIIDPSRSLGYEHQIRVIGTSILMNFLLEIREKLGDFDNKPDPSAVQNAQALISQRLELAKRSYTRNEFEPEAENRFLKTLTIQIDQQLDSQLTSQAQTDSTTPEQTAVETLKAWFQKQSANSDNLVGVLQDDGDFSEHLKWEITYNIAIYPRSEYLKLYGILRNEKHDADRTRLKQMFKETIEWSGSQIKDGGFSLNYVHFKISIPPMHPVFSVIDPVISSSSIYLAHLFEEQETSIVERSFWVPEYTVTITRSYKNSVLEDHSNQ